MKAEFRIITWERVSLDAASDEQIKAIQQAMANDEITSSNSLIDYCEENDVPYSFEGTIGETETQMLPVYNDDYSTIELYGNDDIDSPTWENGKSNLGG